MFNAKSIWVNAFIHIHCFFIYTINIFTEIWQHVYQGPLNLKEINNRI